MCLKKSHSEEKERLKLKTPERIHCFPSPNFRVLPICYLKVTCFSHCLPREAWANVTVSAVNDFASFFFFYVLATIELIPLMDMWVICAVFVLAWIISPFHACELVSSHTMPDKNLKQEGRKQRLSKSACSPGNLSWMNLITKHYTKLSLS